MTRTIRDFQKLMDQLYGPRDQSRGIGKSLLWLQTEQGELVDAFLKNDKEGMEEEVGDILAWLCSICNLLSIDLEKAAWKKYPNSCPRCSTNPCTCSFF